MAALAALTIAVSAQAADLTAGRTIFAKCRICHTVETDAASTVGPNLHGIFGRKAGALDNYQYSAAMQRSGVVWDDATLARYLRDPRSFIPGNKMAFPGIHNDTEIDNLLAYLKQATR